VPFAIRFVLVSSGAAVLASVVANVGYRQLTAFWRLRWTVLRTSTVPP
jgi:hypothetical protein